MSDKVELISNAMGRRVPTRVNGKDQKPFGGVGAHLDVPARIHMGTRADVGPGRVADHGDVRAAMMSRMKSAAGDMARTVRTPTRMSIIWSRVRFLRRSIIGFDSHDRRAGRGPSSRPRHGGCGQ